MKLLELVCAPGIPDFSHTGPFLGWIPEILEIFTGIQRKTQANNRILIQLVQYLLLQCRISFQKKYPRTEDVFLRGCQISWLSNKDQPVWLKKGPIFFQRIRWVDSLKSSYTTWSVTLMAQRVLQVAWNSFFGQLKSIGGQKESAAGLWCAEELIR